MIASFVRSVATKSNLAQSKDIIPKKSNNARLSYIFFKKKEAKTIRQKFQFFPLFNILLV
ncbi:hypothetical protein AJM72_00025 [Campylobacter jejuni]|nr:hypothetical protein AJM72_00025 [Campylobacter jejuni]OEW52878.1 hypothetical protein AJM74_00005 [Campylobacter jejuni]OEX73510.1 hypothetical protein A0K60_00025 [Campylobacter jejuni]OIN32442.1 hypothetical protein AJY51_00025 [Campylobacter jejuni]